MKCKDIMSERIKFCHENSTIKEAVNIMNNFNCGVVPVVDENNKISGLVTDRDIALYSVLQEENAETTELKDFMTRDIITCDLDDDIDQAIEKMKRYKVRRLPVVNPENEIVGLLSLGDIAVKSGEEHETFEALEYISEPSGSKGSSW